MPITIYIIVDMTLEIFIIFYLLSKNIKIRQLFTVILESSSSYYMIKIFSQYPCIIYSATITFNKIKQ
jgi:hypothetical protein